MRLPVMAKKCKTCPFRKGGWTELAPFLVNRLFTEKPLICHSTGQDAPVRKKSYDDAHLCRGARDIALGYFAIVGYIVAPTDAAWEQKCTELGIK